MLKNKIAVLLAVAVSAVFVCVSCRDNTLPPELPPDNTEITENTDVSDVGEEQNQEITELPDIPDVQVPEKEDETQQQENPVQPAIQYSVSDITDIRTFDGSKYSVFELFKADGTPVSGIIDIDGNILCAEENSYFVWCDYHGWISTASNTEDLPELDGYTFGQCGHGGSVPSVGIYNVNTEKRYLTGYGEGSMFVTETESFPDLSPYIVYRGELTIDDGNGNASEEFMQYFDERFWGGEGFEFEFTDVRGNPASLGVCSNVPHSFTNGYIAFMRDGKYGYLDEYGEEMTGFIYDDAETAYDGFAWVCENGKWQTVNLQRN